MDEIYFLAPWANPTELIRSLARFGRNTMGLRIMNTLSFAQDVLMRAGVSQAKAQADSRDAAKIVYQLFRDSGEGHYFANASYADAKEFVKALRSLRMLLPGTEEDERSGLEKLKGGEFPEKNEAILDIYDRYRAELKRRELADEVDTIRFAAGCEFSGGLRVRYCSDFPLTPLETALMNRACANPEGVSLLALYGCGDDAPGDWKPELFKSYGKVNEVEKIIADIFSTGGKQLDQCTVAVTDPAGYGPLWYEYANHKDGFPVDLGCGISIMDTAAGKLTKLLREWNTTGYHGITAVNNMVWSPVFDRKKFFDGVSEDTREQHDIVNMLGGLRISFDKNGNAAKIRALRDKLQSNLEKYPEEPEETEKKLGIMEKAEALTRRLEQGFADVIGTYTAGAKSSLEGIWKTAKLTICDAVADAKDDAERDMLLDDVLGRSVCAGTSRGGSLFVTPLTGAFSSLRENLYVSGLTARLFPGAPMENFLLLDCDYRLFGDPEVENYIPASGNLVSSRIDQFNLLMELAKALGIRVTLSYPCFDTAELKQDNPSSVLFPEDTSYKDFVEGIPQTGYFDSRVLRGWNMGEQYVENNGVFAGTEAPAGGEPEPPADLFAREYSPTAVEAFYKCPKKFYLKYVLKIHEPNEPDEFKALEAYEFGNFIHLAMEGYDASQPDAEEKARTHGTDIIDAALLEKVPVSRALGEAEKERFLEHLENAIKLDSGRTHEASEKEVSGEIEINGKKLKIRGRTDRVEKDGDGNYYVVDYKTGRTIDKEENDIKTCIQVCLYGYLLNRSPDYAEKLKAGEYHFTSTNGGTVCCDYGELKWTAEDGTEHRGFEALRSYLGGFADALKAHAFPCASDDDACKYCKLAGICGKNTVSKEDDGE